MGFRIKSLLTTLNVKPSLAMAIPVSRIAASEMFSSEVTFYSVLSLLLLRPYKRPLFKPFWVSTPIWGRHHRYLFFKLNHWFSFFGPSLFWVSSYTFFFACLITNELDSEEYLYSEAWFRCQDVEYGWENQICVWRWFTKQVHIQIRPELWC